MSRGRSSTSSGSSSADLDMEQEKRKKRTRLNLSHMSLEEKIKRRKMKNREAAQMARDRKKAKMTDLEAATAKFAEDRLKLAAENAAIRKQMQRLQDENEALRQRLSLTSPLRGASARPDVDTVSETSPFESAELIHASQPQTQGQGAETGKQSESRMASPHWTMPFVCLLAVMANLTTSSSGCKSAQRSCCNNRCLLQRITHQYEKEIQNMGIPDADLSSLSRSWQTFGT